MELRKLTGPLLLVRAAFPLLRVVQAFAYVIGLGYYKLDINGRRVSDHELGAFTTYTQRVRSIIRAGKTRFKGNNSYPWR